MLTLQCSEGLLHVADGFAHAVSGLGQAVLHKLVELIERLRGGCKAVSQRLRHRFGAAPQLRRVVILAALLAIARTPAVALTGVDAAEYAALGLLGIAWHRPLPP